MAAEPAHRPGVADLLRSAAKALGDDGTVEAAMLLGHVLARPRSWLMAFGEFAVEDAQRATFDALLARRVAGEPMAYLVGRRAFWAFDLAVGPATLIPRADTERLVELALERLGPDAQGPALDLGTGSGAIALALAYERPMLAVIAVERSAAAAGMARANAAALGLSGRVRVVEGSWFVPLAGQRFALIASNPPYIEDADPHLDEGDLRFEPRDALASGADGLDDLRAIVAAAPAHLFAGGWLLVEHGWRQGTAVLALFKAAGFSDAQTAQDLEGRDRVTLGRLP